MTIPATSRTQDLVFGLGRYLANLGVGFTWRDETSPFSASELYGPTELGFFVGSLPDKPAQCVAITTYTIDVHPTLTSDLEGVQFLIRGGTSWSRTIAIRDHIRRHLRGRFPLRLPTGLHLASLAWSSGASLGVDSDRRWTWSDSYHARIGTTHTA